MKSKGNFIISLDFELLWGVRDKRTSDSYKENLIGVWEIMPQMVELFETHKVTATFATVGFLFASNKNELLQYVPSKKPGYKNSNLSPYNGHFDLIVESEKEDKFHFAKELIEMLKKYPNQEIATHTFSHYYCLEDGQDLDDFKNDMNAAIKIANKNGIKLHSLVFPRNQFNHDYLQICKELGISSYRGNEKSWFYTAIKGENEKLIRRFFRLVDTYFNISGNHCYSIDEIASSYPYNIPSSRLLRPYSQKLDLLEKLRLRRIKKSMTHAARKKLVYHLWWHPHNFGVNQAKNFWILGEVLSHYTKLNKKYKFQSITMAGISEEIEKHYG